MWLLTVHQRERVFCPVKKQAESWVFRMLQVRIACCVASSVISRLASLKRNSRRKNSL